MPGIVGLISKKPREQAEAEVRRMVKSMLHEPSYVSGTWSNEELGIYVGWVARGGSFGSSMPLVNERSGTVLVFSGEEFPDPQMLAQLRAAGHAAEAGDASYLVHCAEHDEFPRHLNGRFHGIAVNTRTGAATLFNDRYGMHRLYYHEAAEGSFYFAAEAKAILAVRPELRALDEHGLAEFISCGCTLNNRTIFRNIHVLAPASAWQFEGRGLRRRGSYFNPAEWEQQQPLDVESYYQQLREVFERILPRYFSGPEKIAISLTGGLDTRMILSWFRPKPGTLPSFSFGGIFRDCQDVKIARRVAAACGQTHQVIPVGTDFLNQFARYAERTVFLTDGCTEVKQASDLYVNERAAAIAPVRMTGNYGGEVLRAIRAFKPVAPPPGLFSQDLDAAIQQANRTYQALVPGHPLSFSAFRQAPWHHYGLLSLEQSQVSVRSPYLDNEFVQTVFRAPQSTLADNDISLRLIADGNPALRRIRTDRGLGGSLPQLPAWLLRQYLEFTFKAEYAYDYGMPQPVVRADHALSPLHLERLFLGRHKFYHFRYWYRAPLASYVKQILLDPRTLSRPWWERGTVEKIVDGHTRGISNHTTAIHKLLTLEHAHRLFLDA